MYGETVLCYTLNSNILAYITRPHSAHYVQRMIWARQT
ncbi:Uncharacterised protein [Vibrio cholerae]|nr:Uncharacterised protein [Vibrio cholerae]CSI96188.1 Uncharacterised protein [Vibrio cholerae]